ncbi:MAG TPA: prolipoprotein diacylglyceryl transferase [Halanaerobiaceae bacterium]|jgi:phosphatidylglycerol:prolipoprotein diacylglycerol transferase|nr:prolipoprotein diacylglyceryl transferase [Bacillota bacterium]HHU92528.1 prolipoprotein diacylglyceryl transferase [Halanaerobiaceae bacterium]
MIEPVAFKLGTLEVRWYGVIIGTAIFLGTILSIREAKRRGIEEDFMLDLFIRVIPAAIIGGRLYFVIFSWDYYKDNLLQILAFRSGGMAIHGAILGGIIAGYIFAKRRKQPLWQLLDIVAPYLVLGQAIGRWGNFFNQEAHGGVVSKEFISIFPAFIKDQMYIGGQYYHPAFLYESLWDFFVFLFLIYMRRRPSLLEGDLFLLYIITYSIGRFFIEGIRLDSLMLGSFRVAQLLSICFILAGIIMLYRRHRKRGK